VAITLIIFHFAVPFLLLLTRFVKRRAEMLRSVAALLLVMSMVDIFWLITPAFNHDGPLFHPTDWLAILGIGGLWLWRYASELQGRPLLPLNDPRLKALMQHA
jgi:peptidoglycan/LPS O-acetylase OafA/YrhL